VFITSLWSACCYRFVTVFGLVLWHCLLGSKRAASCINVCEWFFVGKSSQDWIGCGKDLLLNKSENIMIPLHCMAVRRLWSTYHGHWSSSCHRSTDESIWQHAARHRRVWCMLLLLSLFFRIYWTLNYITVSCAFSDLTLLVGRQEGHLACKKHE